MPSKRRISPAKRNVSPGVSVSMNYSSISPEHAARRAPDRLPERCASADQPHLQHVGFDDGADIQPVLLRDARMRDAPEPVRGLLELGVALIGAQRVAAGRDEIDHGVEILARRGRDRAQAARHLVVELIGVERPAAGAAEHVLRQHVEPAGARGRRVLRVRGDGLERRLAFEHLEAVGRHEQRREGSSSRWLERPMRCSRRLAPFGAPTWMTRSTSPQSMPRSSVEVQTTARSLPGRHRRLDLAPLRRHRASRDAARSAGCRR